MALLHWLLLPSTRRRVVLQQVSEQEFRQRLQQTQPGVKLPILSSTPQAPVAILENASASQQSLTQSSQVIIAYHGTSFENVHRWGGEVGVVLGTFARAECQALHACVQMGQHLHKLCITHLFGITSMIGSCGTSTDQRVGCDHHGTLTVSAPAGAPALQYT
jgi:hypothetical protein